MTISQEFMQHALRLAAQGIGACAPNPSVGCVIVKDNQIIGVGRTAAGGRPHAETQALAMAAMAGAEAAGATLYVTLEPCSHHGRTPPCAQAIIDAGIAKVVVGCADPYPQVNGSGVEMLRKAGIEVVIGVCEREALESHCGFFSRVRRLRPWVTLKVATSADGFIATKTGESQWITGEKARNHGHLVRAQSDAILTGSGTFKADKPQLTCRLAGLEDRSPRRYILSQDSGLEIQDSGWKMLNGSLNEALRQLASDGINHLMVEAGAKLSASFLQENLIDELYWYRAPMLLGSGISAFSGQYDSALAKRPKPLLHKEQMLGADRLSIYRFTDPCEMIKP